MSDQEYRKAKKFLLELSRGEIPMRQCSPYGHLQIDYDVIKERARKAYEYILSISPKQTGE